MEPCDFIMQNKVFDDIKLSGIEQLRNFKMFHVKFLTVKFKNAG